MTQTSKQLGGRADELACPAGPSDPLHYPRLVDRSGFLALLETREESTLGTAHSALILLDVNDFQSVNDAFGTNVGDSVLEIIGQRVLVALGSSVAVGALGGDRFGILSPVHSRDEALRLGRKLLSLFRTPIRARTYDIAMTARVGISLFTQGEMTPSSALRLATAALSEAKGATTSAAVVCAASTSERSETRAVIRRELGEVVDPDRLRLVYQPIVALPEGTVMGYEALVRWRTADGIEVSAEEFISVAESIGLIEMVGRWALEQVVREVSRLKSASSTTPLVAVNLSARQFADPQLVDNVSACLAMYDVAPSRLALEITESVAISAPHAGKTLRDLRGLGCHVGIDDFGTGQSCLSYLRSLPIDFIKIDRSFVAEVATDKKAARLIQTIVGMAHDLGHRTVAEGIETDAQYEQVLSAACDFGQGYLLGYPMPPEMLQVGERPG
jgi:diguanylate cyclase (GGDEF)-like protein